MLRGASWVTSEESKGSRERVSHMRGSAQSAQSGDVVDAMAPFVPTRRITTPRPQNASTTSRRALPVHLLGNDGGKRRE